MSMSMAANQGIGNVNQGINNQANFGFNNPNVPQQQNMGFNMNQNTGFNDNTSPQNFNNMGSGRLGSGGFSNSALAPTSGRSNSGSNMGYTPVPAPYSGKKNLIIFLRRSNCVFNTQQLQIQNPFEIQLRNGSVIK